MHWHILRIMTKEKLNEMSHKLSLDVAGHERGCMLDKQDEQLSKENMQTWHRKSKSSDEYEVF